MEAPVVLEQLLHALQVEICLSVGSTQGRELDCVLFRIRPQLHDLHVGGADAEVAGQLCALNELVDTMSQSDWKEKAGSSIDT